MGYTMEKGKAVIWTQKIFEADKYPFNSDGENYTYFYRNLRDNKALAACRARLSDEEKKRIVADATGLAPEEFILKSKKQHYNQSKKA